VGAAASGTIAQYSNDKIGIFCASHGVSYDLTVCESHKVLSAIYETYLSGQRLYICLEKEKQAITNSGIRATTLEEIYSSFPVTFVDKQVSILRSLYRLNPNIGEHIPIHDFQPYMFYSKNDAEMGYLIDLMNKKELIKEKVSWTGSGEPEFTLPITIAEQGWILLENLVLQENSKDVFVAMWFHNDMDGAFAAITMVAKEFGFRAFRIDKKEHNNEISGEILYEIRKCRFLVADVTGQRHGVYFEAGYAMGRGIPVIWTCKSSDLADVHFDTKQYNHVVWEKEQDLGEKLRDRIKGTILK
jgi:hypothetical protein